MVYGESGRHTILLEMKQILIAFWAKLLLNEPLKISYHVYKPRSVRISTMTDVLSESCIYCTFMLRGSTHDCAIAPALK